MVLKRNKVVLNEKKKIPVYILFVPSFNVVKVLIVLPSGTS